LSKAFFSTAFHILSLGCMLFSCGSYRQNIMFRVSESTDLKKQIHSVEKNYLIQPNDLISLQVYTNDGERLIDPDFRLMHDIPASGNINAVKPVLQYLVDQDGIARLPMVGEIKLAGLTLRQAEGILQKEFAKFYKDPFISLQYQSKRVVVLGATGGQVIPLQHNNVTLVEVLALAQGVPNDGKAHNIRVMRGDQIMVADLSTFDGYVRDNIVMSPGDVVYVEPIRRPFAESIRDYSPLITILTSLTTLIVVVVGL
jgi:polysaccharide biosynthesis/export protein